MRITLEDGATLPQTATDHSAGYDLCALSDGVVNSGGVALVTTGVRVEIPEGCAGFVCSRSGMALKKSVFVLNAPGVIDSDYRGDVGVILFNAGIGPFEYKAGDRVAQLLIVSVKKPTFKVDHQLSLTDRGAGGFGSTGMGLLA